ncbi:MAG: hypothetical protein E7020_02310 [Alphaproteobacteria bacterium]|nr:hypothetical protein [Alphaproteobacteria bacterium]
MAKEVITRREKIAALIAEKENEWWEMEPSELREILDELDRQEETHEEALDIIRASRRSVNAILSEKADDDFYDEEQNDHDGHAYS